MTTPFEFSASREHGKRFAPARRARKRFADAWTPTGGGSIHTKGKDNAIVSFPGGGGVSGVGHDIVAW
jgi:hypothetical protein